MSVNEMMSELAPGRREAVEKEAARLIVESRTLRELRRVLGLTQEQVAEAVETSQARVAQIEKTTDVKISTVAKVVEALGGTLQLVAVLPGREAVTLKFGEDGITSRQAITSVHSVSDVAAGRVPLGAQKGNKREVINTGADKRYARRTESEDIGRSLSRDVKKVAKMAARSSYGEKKVPPPKKKRPGEP